MSDSVTKHPNEICLLNIEKLAILTKILANFSSSLANHVESSVIFSQNQTLHLMSLFQNVLQWSTHCSKHIVAHYFVLQSIHCVVKSRSALQQRASLFFPSVWLSIFVVSSLFSPHSQFLFCDEMLVFVQSLWVLQTWLFVFQRSECVVKKKKTRCLNLFLQNKT